jgi:hypothetical protein
MGKDPDTIYGEIRDHRRKMTSEIEHLEHRVQDDMGQVKDRVAAHTPGPPTALTDRASEHPMASIAVGFGLGIAAGMLSESAGSLFGGGSNSRDGQGDGRGYRDYRKISGRDGRDSGGGGVSSLLAPGGLSKMLFGFASDAIKPLVDDVVAGFKGDERPAAQRDYAQEPSSGRGSDNRTRDAA